MADSDVVVCSGHPARPVKIRAQHDEQVRTRSRFSALRLVLWCRCRRDLSLTRHRRHCSEKDQDNSSSKSNPADKVAHVGSPLMILTLPHPRWINLYAIRISAIYPNVPAKLSRRSWALKRVGQFEGLNNLAWTTRARKLAGSFSTSGSRSRPEIIAPFTHDSRSMRACGNSLLNSFTSARSLSPNRTAQTPMRVRAMRIAPKAEGKSESE